MQNRANRQSLRRKIEAALKHTPDRSDRSIAEDLGTTHVTVGKVRRQLGLSNPNSSRLGRDGKRRQLPAPVSSESAGDIGRTANEVKHLAADLIHELQRLKMMTRATEYQVSDLCGLSLARLRDVIQASL